MSGITDSEAQRAQGVRLKAVREALGLSQEAVADVMGVGVTALSAWENGRNKIDIVKLARAAARWRFSTDWIALGDLSGIRKDLADRLEADLRAGPDERTRRGRPTGRSRTQGTKDQSSDESCPAIVPLPQGGARKRRGAA